MTHEHEVTRPSGWAAIAGKWAQSGSTMAFTGPDDATSADAFGLAVSSLNLVAGEILAEVVLEDPGSIARVAFGHDINASHHFYVGLGGTAGAYSLEHFVRPASLTTIAALGHASNLISSRFYLLNVAIDGQTATITVDGVAVVAARLPDALAGQQVGVVALGRGGVEFRDLRCVPARPHAFAVMQFGEPYDSLYAEVIAPTCNRSGFAVTRAADVAAPGVVLSDIIDGIASAAIVIAEITPSNARRVLRTWIRARSRKTDDSARR